MNEKERERSGIAGGTVGRDVPDESKERHTEIAVEAGRKGAAGMDEKPRTDSAHQTGGGHAQSRQERMRSGIAGGTVGRDIPDESKERHTEIAAEAGKKGGQSRKAKG
jgi:general stress protein YciG